MATVIAQDVIQVSIGASYTDQVYYTLGTDETEVLDNDDWDIAFAITSPTEAGIHINESIDLSFAGDATNVLLYKAPISSFEDSFELEEVKDSLYNPEVNWGNGAFNMVKDEANPFDYGWGAYNPGNHKIEGTTIYAIKLRDDSWKKLIIESFIAGIYTLKYADFDGSNEETTTINMLNHTDAHLVYFSFSNGVIVDNAPKKWDLFFGRYSSLLDAQTHFLEYTVAGVLSAPNVSVAQANEIDVANVSYEDYKGELNTEIDIIGHDWKSFDFSSGWVISDDRVYFVKTVNDHVWKINFLDFEGSSTGVSTFESMDLGLFSRVNELDHSISHFKVYPNPVPLNEDITVAFQWEQEATVGTLSLVNMNGQTIINNKLKINRDLNIIDLNNQNLNVGSYILCVKTKSGVISRKITVQ